ncbi:MAG: hypothetical protein LBC42_01045, partial [Puniceicoccales bacterium]|nr:hypothetical protein [Puniceicoccales bacterium]
MGPIFSETTYHVALYASLSCKFNPRQSLIETVITHAAKVITRNAVALRYGENGHPFLAFLAAIPGIGTIMANSMRNNVIMLFANKTAEIVSAARSLGEQATQETIANAAADLFSHSVSATASTPPPLAEPFLTGEQLRGAGTKLSLCGEPLAVPAGISVQITKQPNETWQRITFRKEVSNSDGSVFTRDCTVIATDGRIPNCNEDQLFQFGFDTPYLKPLFGRRFTVEDLRQENIHLGTSKHEFPNETFRFPANVTVTFTKQPDTIGTTYIMAEISCGNKVLYIPIESMKALVNRREFVVSDADAAALTELGAVRATEQFYVDKQTMSTTLKEAMIEYPQIPDTFLQLCHQASTERRMVASGDQFVQELNHVFLNFTNAGQVLQLRQWMVEHLDEVINIWNGDPAEIGNAFLRLNPAGNHVTTFLADMHRNGVINTVTTPDGRIIELPKADSEQTNNRFRALLEIIHDAYQTNELRT